MGSTLIYELFSCLCIAWNFGVNKPDIISVWVVLLLFPIHLFVSPCHVCAPPGDSHCFFLQNAGSLKLSFPSDELVLRWEREKEVKNEVNISWKDVKFVFCLSPEVLSPYLFQKDKFLSFKLILCSIPHKTSKLIQDIKCLD